MRYLSKRDPLYVEAIRLKQLEKIHNKGPFAILSPYKTGEKEEGGLSISVNKKRYDVLIKNLQKKYKIEQAKGYWGRPEKSMLIQGMPFSEAMQIAKEYDQEAFIHKEADGPVVLYNLQTSQAIPAEKIDISVENPDIKTLIRNVGFNYDFSANPFPLGASIKWSDIKAKIDQYQKTMETKKEKPESKYQQKQLPK